MVTAIASFLKCDTSSTGWVGAQHRQIPFRCAEIISYAGRFDSTSSFLAYTSSLHLEILRRRLAAVAYDFVFNLLPLIERREARPLHCRDMDKHVLTTALRLDEPVTLGRIEPFHRSGRHLGLQTLVSSLRNPACTFRLTVAREMRTNSRPRHHQRQGDQLHQHLDRYSGRGTQTVKGRLSPSPRPPRHRLSPHADDNRNQDHRQYNEPARLPITLWYTPSI
jgi:hypothetical protein